MALKLAILTNILAPYRIPLYIRLAERFEVRVLISGEEPNRSTWQRLDEHLARAQVSLRRAWGVTFRRVSGGGQGYLHINPGYMSELVRFRPNAVISNEMGFRSLVALGWHLLSRRPMWVWWGGTSHTEQAIGPFRSMTRAVFVPLAPRWITYGATSTGYLLRRGVSPDRILQVQNCVDDRMYASPHQALFDIRPKPVLLVVGQLIPRKGIDRFMGAVSKLQREGQVFSSAIVGDGPERENLQRQARHLQIRNIHWLPSQPPEAMPSVYQSGDCLVFPTLSDPWGLVVNEAVLAGLPVASSVYAGCAAELVPSENVFDPLNEENFADVLKAAVTGRLRPSDRSKVVPLRQVADMIADAVEQAV